LVAPEAGWPGAAETTSSFFTPEDVTAQDSTTSPPPVEPETRIEPAWGAPRPAWEEEPGPSRTTERPETYGADIPVALASALLGASVFLPWYTGPPGYGLSVSAWATGSWGPVILFLAAGSLLLVALRRVGLAVSLPIEESLVHEAAGWLALAAAVLKSRFRPGLEGLLLSYGLWVGIGGAVLLIILAGRMSPHAPLVFRPGWHRGRAGKIGAVVLLAMIGGSAAFGMINTTPLVPKASVSNVPGVITGRLPDCAKGFPVPSGVRPTQAFERPCQAQLSSDKTAADVTAAFDAALKQGGWTFTSAVQGPGATTFTLTKPTCGTLVVVGAQGGTIAIVAFGPCPTTQPTAG
jgi:hypothetical protein